MIGAPVQRVRKAYEQVYDQLRELIMRGELARDQRLPGEAELAREFGVSRGTVREALPLDDFCDLLTIQAVGAGFLEENPGVFDNVKRIVAMNSPYTVRQACLAMERMDLEPLVDQIARPILFTNGSRDIMTPPDLAPSGYSARQIVERVPEFARLHEFPHIGHADLLEAPEEAVRVVTAFFKEVLAAEQPSPLSHASV